MKTKLHFRLILMGLILIVFISINCRAQLNWEKYESNPVMQVEPGSWYSWNVFFPVVIYEENTFKMWFCGSNENPGRHIGYATSTDGLDWEDNIFSVPVISSGDPGPWALDVYPGSVLRINDTLRMWFSGSTNSVDNGSIGYAWSVEPYIWHVLPEPVLEKGESGTWEDVGVFHPSVHYDGAMYHMYYSGSDNNFETMEIGHAISFDGLNWERDVENNPVIPLGLSGSYYDTWVTARMPIMYDDTLRMFFAGFDGTTTYPNNGYYSFVRVGYAWTTDYINWNIHSDPVVVGDPGEWDETMVHGPSVMIHDGRYKMWYWGDSYNSYWEIGYALGDTIIISDLSEKINPIPSVINVYPSPFTDNLTITYTIQEKSRVELEMYNSSGKLISKVVNEVQQQGKQEIVFNTTDLPAGIYFCVLTTVQSTITKKIIKLN